MFALLLVFACSDKADSAGSDDTSVSDTDADSDTDSDSDSDSDSDTDSDADADMDTDADSDTDADTDTEPCADKEPIPLAVTGVVLDTVGATDPHVLTVTASGPGAARIVDESFVVGCCPDVVVEATAVCSVVEIQPVYALTNDVCDCIAGLKLSYSVAGIPAGDWEVVSYGLRSAVTIGE